MNKELLELKLEIYQKILAYTLSNDSSYIVDEIKRVEAQLELIKDDYEIEDKDVEEIISTTRYADGKPVETKMQYKYRK